MDFRIITFLSFIILAESGNLTNSRDAVIKHLEAFGYLKTSNHSIVHLEEALIQYQEYYNLNVTGEITEELVNFIKAPRCSLSDEKAFTARSRWGKRLINWHVQATNDKVKKIAAAAFNEWQKISALTFVYSPKTPDIIISFGSYTHKNSGRCRKGTCPWPFSGPGDVLGHATYPNNQNTCQEMHIDESENWYFGLDTPKDETKISLYAVIIHEIGHNLGLDHSSDPNSVMFAYFSPGSIALTDDDKNGVQHLYGEPQITTIKPTIKPKLTTKLMTTKTTTTTKPEKLEENQADLIDLCQIEYPEQMLVTNNNHLYIFYKGLVWILKIGEPSGKNLKRPRKTSDYIGSYNDFSHIYQKPNGRMVLINKSSFNTYYFPSLAYEAFNKTISNFDIPKDSKINAIFNSNMGRTFILYDDWYFTEFDECSLKTINHGLIKEKFSGVPLDISSAFRYINGHIYFFRKDIYYEFSEFSDKLIRAGPFDWSLFGINCPNETILNQLKNILTALSKYFSN